MISTKEAEAIIQGARLPYEIESVSLDYSLGRVLAEPLYADRDFPPFHRVAMDGIAIVYETYEQGQRSFPIAAMAPAGTPQVHLNDTRQCVEVMTGTILPAHTDTVIRYEDLRIEGKIAFIEKDVQVKAKQNVHRRGSDRRSGDLLVTKGQRIGAADIGIAATVGKTELDVVRPPRCIVISTGDELVAPNMVPAPHQIRRSNVYNLKAALQKHGVPADDMHLVDDRAHLVRILQSVLESYELVILSGGVSKGKFDYVPQVLEDLGVRKLFHGVRQRPGKPLWFGHSARNVVFALPGNPVSSYMCTMRYVLPWLDKVMGLKPKEKVMAVLGEDFTFKPDLTYYLQVKISYSKKGELLAYPIAGGGSGDLANLTKVDAFLELPRGKEHFYVGEVYEVYFF